MMGWRIPEQGWRKGLWTPEEDRLLGEYVKLHGEGRWSSVARCSGLNRSGKSCRLRWVNYLRPGLKRGQLTPQEEGIIIELHALWGNKWSTIASYLPGRTDNEIKNYWRTHFKKKPKSSKKQEKLLKSQVLNQKFHQQQQQQQLGDEVKSMVEITDEKMHEMQEKQENMELKQPTSMEDQWIPAMSQDVSAAWTDFLMDDIELWSGLWNLDDQVVDHTSNWIQMAKQYENDYYTNGGYIL